MGQEIMEPDQGSEVSKDKESESGSEKEEQDSQS